MRILDISPYLPWPLDSGGKAALFSTLQCLAADHDFTLVCPVFSGRDQMHADEIKEKLPNVVIRAVICGGVAESKGFRRLLLRSLGLVQRTIEPAKPTAPLPSYPFHPLPPQLIEAIGKELERGTDLVQAEFAPMLPLGPWLPQDIPKLFIHHQVQFVYSKRFVETHGTSFGACYLNAMMLVQELAYLPYFDAVVTFGERDRQALLPHFPSDCVFVSPFPIPADVGIVRETSGGFDGRFLFVASEGHDPNRDGLEWLLSEIWPEISKQLPSARMVVIGDWSRFAQDRRAAEGIAFRGFVNDLAAEMQGGIMLVPLRIGSGIRVKILVAMAQGVPIVTTPVGVEGLLARDEKELLVRAAASDFAEAAVRLAQDPELRKRLAEAGRDCVRKHYSPEEVMRQRNKIYEAVVANRRCEKERQISL